VSKKDVPLPSFFEKKRILMYASYFVAKNAKNNDGKLLNRRK
jgi:hypothetical protein